MNERTVREWIIKAESDLKIGKDEFLTDKPVCDAICFHMQQCVEKYLKAFLIFHGKEIRKTHVIAEIVKECMEIDPEFQKLFKIEAQTLTDFAVEFRYPAEALFPSIEETKEAIEIAEKVKNFVREKLKDRGYELPRG
ncbi:MAG: HEPN domain-containing protein [Deltaproteobacteria bacterium]|nr:HEPN domain-containing protein [Deltaproteobacteria bacterium]